MADTAERFRLDEFEGFPSLVADGVILSVDPAAGDPPFGYWTAMLPDARVHRALILGLGGGTLAHLLARRFPGVRITGIDNDAEVIAFARRHFALGAVANLTVRIADAIGYLAHCREQFDYVAVDLFHGHEFMRASLSRPFLRDVKRVASAHGEVAFNLFHDGRSTTRVSRIHRILPVVRVDRLPQNVVVHCAAQGSRVETQARETRGGWNRRKRSELLTTDTEESAMAADASIGSSSRPVNGYRMPAAIGMPRTL